MSIYMRIFAVIPQIINRHLVRIDLKAVFYELSRLRRVQRNRSGEIRARIAYLAATELEERAKVIWAARQ